MKAMIIRRFGGPEVFEEGEVTKPKLLPGHVLIKVKATSVNPVDYKIRKFGPPIAPAFPAVLHGDVSGIVEEVADNVSAWKKGDEVFGCVGGLVGTGGALAEYILADERLIALKPKNLNFVESAVLPLVSITAWEGLFEKGNLQAGNKILITGGAGGVGHIAVQLARWAGARVFATVTEPVKRELVLKLGAEAVSGRSESEIQRRALEQFGTADFDLALDTGGGSGFETAIAMVKRKGKAITINASGTFDLGKAHSKSLDLAVVFMLIPLLHNEGREKHGLILKEISRLAEAEILKPVVDPEIFSWRKIGEAHKKLEEGRSFGKIAVVIE
ncbi:zinc-dependent alcohol dehydrogenase family protein [Leptospira stimsonii]|uniref:Quinone oxidoreductase n=1 Tax=Leptospira stimsonii TaxID=2202203 RepID=A0ABY2N5W0_9LEPT|nr:zinc-dependent alcohol dehydrogenase family protein [Leptospira stimsonii]TGK26907.1 quinone oxidoreductase [Leptospira stimsonii]TGM17302.1 quinone oxidoreductase [Leptospira stimsonii]